MTTCHRCEKAHDMSTNGNIYCIECTGEDSFQCEDCCEIKKLEEVEFSTTKRLVGGGERLQQFCKDCCRVEVDEWDGEPTTRTEYWDNYDD